METLGTYLNTDNLILTQTEEVKSFIANCHKAYSAYLNKEAFSAFNIFVPQYTSESEMTSLNNFVKNHKHLTGAVKKFLPINNHTKFEDIVGDTSEDAKITPIFMLPTEDFEYKNLRHKLWHIHLQNYSTIILMPTRVSEWSRNINIFKQMSLKGVQFAVHVPELSLLTGFLDKKILKQMKSERLITFWLTTLLAVNSPKQGSSEKEVKLLVENI